MPVGAKDWTNSVTILAIKPDGTLTPVRINAEGRLEAVMVASDGETVAPITVDDEGHLVCVIHDAVTDEPVKIDTGGRMQVRLVAMEGLNPHDVAVNDDGHLIVSLVGVGEVGLSVDDDGHITCKLSGALTSITDNVRVDQDAKDREMQGETIAGPLHTIAVDNDGRMIGVLRDPTNDRYLAIDEAGNIVAVMKGEYEGTLKTVALDVDGRMETVVKGTKDVTTNLRLWYKFDVGEGANIKDSTPWGNDGVGYVGVSEDSQYADGIVGICWQGNGSNTYIDVGSEPPFNFITEDFTIEFWVKFTEIGSDEMLLCRGLLNTDGWYIHKGANNKLRVTSNQFGATQGVDADTAIAADVWKHIAIVRDGSDVRIYMNGVDDTAGIPDITNPLTSARHLYIGHYDDGSLHFFGQMDELRIYNRALTEAEVLIRYNLTKLGGTGSLQEIAVNQAGQMIVVPRGESGHYLKIDSAGFMAALMKGQEIGAGLHTIATDSDGVMLANIRGMPYESVLFDEDSKALVAVVGGDIDFGPVPAGKIWVMTSAYMYIQSGTCERMEIRIRKGGADSAFVSTTPDGGTNALNFQGQAFFDIDSEIRFHFYNPSLTATAWAGFNGYIVDAYA